MTTPEVKLQEFKTAGLGISLRELANVFGPRADGALTQSDIEKMVQDMPGALARKQAGEEVFGIHDGLISRSGHFSEHQRKLIERLREQGKSDGSMNILLLDALQNDSIGAYIGDAVFGDMSDEELDAVIAEIELETGQPFHEYATEILGDEMPERKPGQSDRAYNEEVLEALADEMFEKVPDPSNPDGFVIRVKPEYADDPTAKVILRSSDYQKIQADVEVINAKLTEHGRTADTDAAVERVVAADITASQIVSDEIDDAVYQDQADLGSDQHRNENSEVANNQAESSAFLAGFGKAASGETENTIQEASLDADEGDPMPSKGATLISPV